MTEADRQELMTEMRWCIDQGFMGPRSSNAMRKALVELESASQPGGGEDTARMDWLEANCGAGLGLAGVLSVSGPRRAMFVRFPIIELDIDAAAAGTATLRNAIDAARAAAGAWNGEGE